MKSSRSNMSPNETPRSPPDNRQRILDAALTLFSENGYSSTSMRDIAKLVGIKAPSIYNHFAGKRDIFDALLSVSGPNKMIRKLETVAEMPQIKKGIPQLIDGLVGMWSEPDDGKLMKMILGEALRDSSFAEDLYQSIFIEERNLLIKIFKNLLKQEKLGSYSPEILADECLSKGLARRLELLLSANPDAALPAVKTGLVQQFTLFFDLLGIEAD